MKNTPVYAVIAVAFIAVFTAWSVVIWPADEEYSSEAIKLGFSFSPTYDLTEADYSTADRFEYSLSLIEEGYVAPEGGEGPTSIAIDVFRNDADGLTAEEFAEESLGSGWRLGPGAPTPRIVAGEPGLEYAWSGLYEGKSVVVARPSFVYVFSVTWMSPKDRILADFEDVLGSVRFVE